MIALVGMMVPIGTLLWDTVLEGEIVCVDVHPRLAAEAGRDADAAGC